MRVAFLGLGKMGCALVPHLLNAGHVVTVWNRNTVVAEKFAAQGAEVARSAADAVTKGEVVFTLLLNDSALEDVLFGGGVLDAMPKGAIHASVSTISVTLAKRKATPLAGTDVALGWFISSDGKEEIVWKSGLSAGCNTFIGFSTKRRRGVVLLSNFLWRPIDEGTINMGIKMINPNFHWVEFHALYV